MEGSALTHYYKNTKRAAFPFTIIYYLISII